MYPVWFPWMPMLTMFDIKLGRFNSQIAWVKSSAMEAMMPQIKGFRYFFSLVIAYHAPVLG
jgi:hypothetical protein